MEKIILFVCTGNSCRSPMAAGLLKRKLGNRKDVVVRSAGVAAVTGMGASTNAIEVMKEEGIDISAHQSRHLTKEMLDEATLILTMTKQHRIEVMEMSPEAKGKVYLLKEFDDKVEEQFLDIPDPMNRPIEDYRICLTKMKSSIKYLAEKVLKEEEIKKER